MKNEKFFMFLFWILTLLVAALLVWVTWILLPEWDYEIMLWYIPVLAVILILGGVAFFIHKDASKRGMNPWMWMSIAIYLPNFIGLIIYLIVRNQYENQSRLCVNCGRPIRKDFRLCPYCGIEQNTRCPHCNKEVSAEWQVCPYCSNELRKSYR